MRELHLGPSALEEPAAESSGAGAVGKATQVQRAEAGPPEVDAAHARAVAGRGVAGAGDPLPHRDAIQRAFGHHDVGSVRAQIGGDAAAAGAAIGARAYTVGEQIAFAGPPDLHTAAHEAAHVVQQRAGVTLAGGVGAAGDDHEQHADRVADAVVAGRSAAALLDERATGSRSEAVQRVPDEPRGNAAMWLHSNHVELRATIRSHLSGVTWREPHPRVSWRNASGFSHWLPELIAEYLGELASPDRLKAMCSPLKPLAVIDRLRPLFKPPAGIPDQPPHDRPHAGGNVGPLDWRSSIALAIAQHIEESIVASLRRIAASWVAAYDREPESEVTFDALVTAHPMDIHVGQAAVHTDAFDVWEQPDQAGAPGKPTDRGHRPVELVWQGAEGRPKLWNWVRAKQPADATAEEVAAALYGTGDEYHGRKSYNAYALTAAPPLFGLPPSWAIEFDAAREHAPADLDDGGYDDRVLAVSTGDVGQAIAFAQAAGEPAPSAGAAGTATATLVDLIDGNRIQIDYLLEALGPWGFQPQILIAFGFVEQSRVEIAELAGADLSPWARVFQAQREILTGVAAGVRGLLDSAGDAGPGTAGGEVIGALLAAYARAAACSHLAETGRALLVEAARRQSRLTLRGVQSSTESLGGAMDMLGASPIDSDEDERAYELRREPSRDDLLHEGAAISERARALQSELIAGGAVDPQQIHEVTMLADEYALRSRARAVLKQVRAMKEAAIEAGDEFFEELSAAFSSDFRALLPKCEELETTLATLMSDYDRYDKGHRYSEAGWHVTSSGPWWRPPEYEAANPIPKVPGTGPRATLTAAQAKFDELATDNKLGKFLEAGMDALKWQTFRTACFKLAALIGISIAAGAAGGMVGQLAGGLMRGAAGVETVAELSLAGRLVAGAANLATDAAVNTIGQQLIDGGSFGNNFLENMLTGAGSAAVLGALAKRSDQVARAATTGWKRVGRGLKIVGSELAALSGHAVMGMAFGYVAHKVTTGKSQPPPETLEEWFLQGAAIAVGRYIQHGLSAVARRNRGKATRALRREALELQRLAAALENHPDANRALELLDRRLQLIDDELASIERRLADHAAGRKELDDDELAELDSLRAELGAQRDGVEDAARGELALHLAGLQELVPGAVWRGTRGEVERLEKSTGAVARRDEARYSWSIELDGKTFEIRERNAHEASQLLLAGADNDLRAAAAWVQPMPDTLDVIVHGDVDDFEIIQADGSKLRFDHRTMAGLIKAAGGDRYKQIRLVSCRTGMHPKGVAQHLANKLGKPVWAPTERVFLSSDGSMVVGPHRDRPTGDFEEFRPQPAERRYQPSTAPDGPMVVVSPGVDPVDTDPGTVVVGRRTWPKPEDWLAGYQPPPAGASPVAIRERLMAAARKLYPTKGLRGRERATQENQMLLYFNRVQEHAASKLEDLEAERAIASPDQHARLDAEIAGARDTIAAAKVRPHAGKLPLNHALAGSGVTVDDIQAMIVDPGTSDARRGKLRKALDVMHIYGVDQIRFTEHGYIDLEPFIYVQGNRLAEYKQWLAGSREEDEVLANNWFADEIGIPGWQPPDGWTWHHHEVMGTMLLVPTEVHSVFGHTGPVPMHRVMYDYEGTYEGSSP